MRVVQSKTAAARPGSGVVGVAGRDTPLSVATTALALVAGSGCMSEPEAPPEQTTGAELAQVRTIVLERDGNPPLLGVEDLAVDVAGNLFVLDGKTGRLHKYGPDGKYLASVPGADGEPAGFWQPSGAGAGSIAFGQDRHLYVTGTARKVAYDSGEPVATVARISPDLAVDTFFTVEGTYFLQQLRAWEDKLATVLARPRGPGNEVAVYDYEGRSIAALHPRDERMEGVPYWSAWFTTRVASTGDELVVANSLYPLHRYGSDGAPKGTLGSASASFRLPSHPELFAFAGPEGRARYDEWLKSFTTIDGVHVLDDSMVVVVLKDLNDRETALSDAQYRTDIFELGSGWLLARDLALGGRVVEADTVLYVAMQDPEEGWRLEVLDLEPNR